MNFAIHQTKDFEGTAYMEVVPGQYTGKHWQDGSIFIEEDDFIPAEGIIRTHLPSYDHYDMNEVSAETGLAIVEEWRRAAIALTSQEGAAADILHLAWQSEGWKAGCEKGRAQIAIMFEDLANFCESCIRDHASFCVLGL